MSEIEKKYSSYQTSDCEVTELEVDTVDEDLCPTCFPNPNFTLEDFWWNIESSYLNEKECEYHVRVFENESAVKQSTSNTPVLEVGGNRILVDLDKALNDASRVKVMNSVYIKDSYRNIRSGTLGTTYLVAIPAFNFDSIGSEEEALTGSEDDTPGAGEIILSVDGLNRKLQQLKWTLRTYKIFYRSAQNAGAGFVIREENDMTARISYKKAIDALNNFEQELNDVLSDDGFAKISRPGWFRAKRAKKIKLVFKSNDKPFDLKAIFAMPDDGCNKYQKLKVKRGNILRKPKMAVIFNFLSNLDQVINDITSKETKPWLEFTLDHFYPAYVVDHGNLGNIEDVRTGLACLLENELGIGNGKVIDSLAKEILSAFSYLESEMAKNACREMAKVSDGIPAEWAKKAAEPSFSEEKKASMIARYQKEYENKAYSIMLQSGTLPKGTNKNTLFQVIKIKDLKPIPFDTPSYKYKNSNGDRKTKESISISVSNESDLKDKAALFAKTKHENLEIGSLRHPNVGNKIQLSPHYQEYLDAKRETLKNPGSTFIQGFKDSINGDSNLDIREIISAFGICGLTKVSGKALECLLGGVSFDRFIGILVEKSFEFMEINTFGLFLNGLPSSFRADLNAEIEKNFGDISLSDLIELKKVDGGSQKMGDIVKSRMLVRNMIDIYSNNNPWEDLSSQDKEVFNVWFGGKGEKNYDLKSFAKTYDFEKRIFKGDDDYARKAKERRLVSTLRGVRIRSDFKGQLDKSILRMTTAFASPDTTNNAEPNGYEEAAKSFEETSLGVKVDNVYDVIFDFAIESILREFALDDLFAKMNNYPVVRFVTDKISEFTSNCPIPPIFQPSPRDFLKTLSLDVCDPHLGLTLPKIQIPSINFRFWAESGFLEIFREALIKIATDIAIKILKKLMSFLESALCNALEVLGAAAADAIAGDLGDNLKNKYNSFLDALNEAFCNDGEDPSSAEERAKALADALFSPVLFDAGLDYEGSGAKVANIISSVASTEEFLGAMVADEGEENEQFNNRVATVIVAMSPEMEVLLGDPTQVAYFFRNLGSFLTPEDRDRIKELLEAGVPNLPFSPALCLTNDQLNEWDDMRNNILQSQGLTPEQAAGWVDKLNEETEKALSDVLDIVGDNQTDGPFIGAATNEMLKDACNPNNVFNDRSQSQFDKEQEDELTEAFFNNISRSLTNSFFSKGGILSEAMADVEGNREFVRGFRKFFNHNYENSQSERDLKYLDKGKFGQWLMDLKTDDEGSAIGIYPDTVALKQRKQILGLEDIGGIEYDIDATANKATYSFGDSSDDFTYFLRVISNNNKTAKNVFDYGLRVKEEVDGDLVTESDFITPVPTSADELSLMESFGFQLNANDKRDPRKALFNKIMNSKLPNNRSYSDLYASAFEVLNNGIVESILTDDSSSDGLPVGYKFGYVSDDLTKESFVYTPSGNPSELGTYASNRIIPLSPDLYGGSYNNPPFFVEPRPFSGWIELGRKAFGDTEGCDPKSPGLFGMKDISDRVKNLSSSLKTDPRLGKPRDCVTEKPFHLLLDSKNKAKLDGVVRTTIRTYIGEYFIKGYGLFSNLQIRNENFDKSMSMYIAGKMKKEMQEIGTFASNKKVRIVRERYWYVFLEQCVEAYQRMIDVDGIAPPKDVMDALNSMQIGMDKYRPIDKDTKRSMIGDVPTVGDSSVRIPNEGYDPISVASQSREKFGLQSVAFRLSNAEEREDFFKGQNFKDIQKRDLRFASIKKLQFFQKIYFIKVFETEASLVMSELIRFEMDRLGKSVVNGITDKPRYYDLQRSFFGMSSLFPSSTSNVGLNQYYADKQRGVLNTGAIPEVRSNNTQGPVSQTSDPQFIIESYIRVQNKPNFTLPPFLSGRSNTYKGVVALSDMSDYISENLGLLEGKKISDYFGDLSFIYSGMLSELLSKGFSSSSHTRKLKDLNKHRGAQFPSMLIAAVRNHTVGREFDDMEVTYDESFLLEGENPTPTGTIGSSGFNYGMRLSLVFPQSEASSVQHLNQDATFMGKSSLEKAYMFSDGTFTVPLIESEVSVIDSDFGDFDPFQGSETYDLECLINKMVDSTEFEVIMGKVFNIKQSPSMTAIYCMETLPAAIGRDDSEREDISDDPDVDDWDRVVNEFGKNFLRREFSSLYLANHPDGQSVDDSDDSERSKMMRIANPLDFLSLPSIRLPWWVKRRMKTLIYDANGEECVDPKKDLT